MTFAVLALPEAGSEQPAVVIPATKDASSMVASYRDINDCVRCFQQDLARIGIQQGSKVAFALPNGLEVVIAFLAVIRQRAIAAPLNPQYKQSEYAEMLHLMQPSLLIVLGGTTESPSESVLAARTLGIPVARCSREGKKVELHLEENNLEKSAALVLTGDIQPDDMALLLYTSGTTGVPKGVILTHSNIIVSMRIIIQAHQLSPSDRCMLITPLFHVAGLCASLLCTLFSGGCAIIPPSLPGSFWQEFKEYRATWFHGVPTLHRLLLSFPRPQEMPAIRFIRSGGSDLSAETFERLEREFGAPVLEIYGLTETAPGIFCNKLGFPRRPAHYPIPAAVEVRILIPASGTENLSSLTDDVDVVGEICVRGKSVMSGYINNPKANKEAFVDGYFRTGDLGVIREGGYLQLTGRVKEIINKGGEKISPSEVEHIVLGHEAVREAACFKVADDIYGEDVGVAVVLHPGMELKAVSLKKFVRERVTAFKVPKKIVFMSEIPTNRTGKPRRVFLSEQFGG